MLSLVVYAIILIMAIFVNNEQEVNADLKQSMRDGTAPVIELAGGDISLAVGDNLVEPGYEIYDDSGLPDVDITSNVNPANEGEYIIDYTATDESGNIATVTRKVKVIHPTGRIYLTFDDGPSEHTAALLDVLKKYGIKATFFVTGYGDDALIQRENREGHTVGLHTFSHNYADIYSSIDSYLADLNQIQTRVKNDTGINTKLMRFPGGSSNLISTKYDGGTHIMTQLVSLLSEQGYTYYDWNVDSDDAGRANDSEAVYQNVINTLKVGGDSVVLQHDTKSYSIAAVEKIIQYGLENGYVFNKLDQNSFPAHHGVNN